MTLRIKSIYSTQKEHMYIIIIGFFMYFWAIFAIKKLPQNGTQKCCLYKAVLGAMLFLKGSLRKVVHPLSMFYRQPCNANLTMPLNMVPKSDQKVTKKRCQNMTKNAKLKQKMGPKWAKIAPTETVFGYGAF